MIGQALELSTRTGMKRAEMYHYTDGGLRNVWLANGYEIKKTPHGDGVAFHNLDGLTRSICMALTRKASLLTGAEFRYIRSAGMLLSQPALGKLMSLVARHIVHVPAPFAITHRPRVRRPVHNPNGVEPQRLQRRRPAQALACVARTPAASAQGDCQRL